MKRFVFFSTALLIVFTISAFSNLMFAQTASRKVPNEKSVSKNYTCPMHPEVVKNVPGKCPKCSMALVVKTEKMKKADGMKDAVTKMYTCSMHPEVMKPKAGKCPKCGMDLIVKKNQVMKGKEMQKMIKDSTMKKKGQMKMMKDTAIMKKEKIMKAK